MGSFIIQTCCLTTALMLSEEAFKREREGAGSVTAIGDGKYLCTGKKSIWRNKKDQHHHHHLQILSPSGDENITSASASVAAECVYYSPVIIPEYRYGKTKYFIKSICVLDISSHFSF